MSDPPVLQNLEDLEASLAARDESPAAWRVPLELLRARVDRYTRLENALVDEAPPVAMPSHLLEQPPAEDPLAAAEDVAHRERTRLGLQAGEPVEPMRVLDRAGFLVFRLPFPPESPLEGLFLFDAGSGPILAVREDLDDAAAQHVFAVLYGHFLFDHDPYRIRWVPPAGEDLSSLRAAAFAGALMIDRRDLEAYLEAAGDGELRDLVRIRPLLAYFEVAPRTLLTRLLALGRLEAGDVARLGAELGSGAEALPEREPLPALPERFVRLALEAHARGAFDLNDLAQRLEVEPARARALADRFELPAREDDDDGGDGGKDDDDA